MRALLSMSALFVTSVAQAHDSVVPHTHPHGVSMLPDVETFGVAALLLALAVIAYTQFKSR